MSLTRRVITEIPTVDVLKNILLINPGLVIVKFGASWCGPCKTIRPLVDAFFVRCPKNVLCFDIDIDQCPQVYQYFKAKRMTNGIPAILCWHKGNTSPIPPDDMITGANLPELDAFFKRCQTWYVENIKIA